VPTLVQYASDTAGSGTTVTVTLGSSSPGGPSPGETTAGNCLIVSAGAGGSSANSVAGITLGGSGGNFAKAEAATESGGVSVDCETWTDQDCAGGQTVVVVTFAETITGAIVYVEEWSGVASSGAVDQASGGGTSSEDWSSGATGTLSQPSELVHGAVLCFTEAGPPAITGPDRPWTSLPGVSAGDYTLMTGYLAVSSDASQTYAGSQTGFEVEYNAAVIVSLLEGSAGPATPAPFTLPGSPATGRRAARRGRSRGSAGAPRAYVPPAVPSPFALPHSPAKGGTAARRGRSHGSPGAPWAYVPPGPPAPFALPGKPVRGRMAARRGKSRGSAGSPAIQPAAAVVNQWAATFSQPSAFGPTPPALQSTVVALNPGTSAGGGSGYPSAGNWLFCVAGWQQANTASPVTAGNADDIHSWWRPAKVSPASGITRTSVWYTPNLARQPADVYTAPNGCMAGMAVLVFEVAGLGPWDELTGVYAASVAASATLNLSLAAPSGQAFVIGAVCGDNDSVSQAFAPAGWTPLHTVTASNGTDHTADAVLTSACLTTSGPVAVSGTAASEESLSGVIIGVLTDAPSPIPDDWANPGWPGRTVLEVALGGGFQTPQDELAWTTVSDSAAPWRAENTPRLWNWRENSTGIQYQLGALQATDGDVQLDNFDGALTPSNTSSPYYPYITAGLPVRLRVAVGTITTRDSSQTYNRWYVIQRNAYKVTELRDAQLRSYVDIKLTDIWSVASATCPTPYRGEVEQDDPYAQWPCDDQPLAGGVLPAKLLNAAPGNTNALNIIVSPAGTGPTTGYSTTGVEMSVFNWAPDRNTALAVYTVGADQGWMYGDPQVSPQSAPSGSPVTAQPGSAAWQQTGETGNTGGYGWFLSCNDTGFPSLATGVTVEGWYNYEYLGSTSTGEVEATWYVIAQQPYCQLTLWALTTNSAPVAILALNTSGHLVFITYDGATPASTTIYSDSDLRSGSWHHYAVTLSASGWTVYVDGGVTAEVSGTPSGLSSSFSWFIGNGDMGTSGGGSTSGLAHTGNCSVSHLAIYPSMLPAWRIRAHYWAALAGFGLIPAPSQVQFSLTLPSTDATKGPAVTPDGLEASGGYGYNYPDSETFTFAAVVSANAGDYTSGPSAWAATGGPAVTGDASGDGYVVTVDWTGVAPSFSIYTAASVTAETGADVTASNSEDFTKDYGSSAEVLPGIGHLAAASSTGDTVQQRIERCLGYGGVTYPGRAIDPASLLVQAALDVGGQQCAQNLTNQQLSDDGFLAVDSPGTLFYRQRSHLAADTPVWSLGPDVDAGQLPYKADQTFGNDPVRVWNAIANTPYSPDGASLPVITPSDATAVKASQLQYGPRPLAQTSYLQSTSEIQSQTDWLFTEFGVMRRRVEKLTVDAAAHPAAWVFVLGASVSDLATVADQPFGGPATSGTFRITQISGRSISMGANGTTTEGAITVIADFEPGSYWE
jgi:Concanavalin A-like lectin/glucanases superfamily